MQFRNVRTAILLLVAAAAIAARMSPTFMRRVSEVTEPGVGQVSNQYVKLVAGSVYDGDTFRVTDGQTETKIRLCGIDAPELEQQGGTEARDRLQQLVERGDGQIILVPVETDQYGRMVAEAFIPLANGVSEQQEEEIHLNSQMVVEGMAYVYPQYVNGCPNATIMQTAERQATPKARPKKSVGSPETR